MIITITPGGREAVARSEERLTQLIVQLSQASGLDRLGELLGQLQVPIEQEATALKDRMLQGVSVQSMHRPRCRSRA